MITRGKIIGNIIDSLSALKISIKARSKLGLYDLNIFCEDFIKELLNIIEDIKLENLNEINSNNPGLDLGDSFNKIAYQVTSDKRSSKINNTLEKITEEQKEKFNDIYVFILGEKQGSYDGVDDFLCKEFNFEKDSNILDLNDIYKKIITLSIDRLKKIEKLVKKDIAKVQAELELPDEDGNYDTTLFNKLELKPKKEFHNVYKLHDFLNEGEEYWIHINKYPRQIFRDEFQKLYNKLKSLPRITREFYSILIEESETTGDSSYYKIRYEKLIRVLSLSKQNINEEISLLTEKNLISFYDESKFERNIIFEGILGEEYLLLYIMEFITKNNLDIRSIFVNLNFNGFAILTKKDVWLYLYRRYYIILD